MSDCDNVYKLYTKSIIASIAVFSAVSVASYTYYLSVVPQTYDECVIQSVPNMNDKALAKVVIDSCLNKFSQNAIQLLPNDISGLTGFGSAKKNQRIQIKMMSFLRSYITGTKTHISTVLLLVLVHQLT